MRFITFKPEEVSFENFISFWSSQYRDPNEALYLKNIEGPFTPETVHQLFVWKNGSRLAARKHRSVENNYIARLDELRKLPKDTDAYAFLNRFNSGGAIWRIFWLHCWQPDRFPIYDQHVHRAMVYIKQQNIEEIASRDQDKVCVYLERYLPFHEQFKGLPQRSVDKALWAFGKFLKKTKFPLE